MSPMASHPRHLWLRCVATVVAVPVLYVASFGPACWLRDRRLLSEDPVDSIYCPLAKFCVRVGIGSAVNWYGTLLPTPQPHLNTSHFGHSGWRCPKSTELLHRASLERYLAEQPQ